MRTLIRRREVIVGLGAWLTLPAAAQARRPRLAMLLVAANQSSAEVSDRRDALAELGWVYGRNIEIVARDADGALDRVPALMAELIALSPDIILTHTAEAARAAAGLARRRSPTLGCFLVFATAQAAAAQPYFRKCAQEVGLQVNAFGQVYLRPQN